MSGRVRLLDIDEILTPADHHTHRRYPFQVPPDCQLVEVWVRYVPKRLGEQQSIALAESALAQQTALLAARVGAVLAEQWSADYRPLTQRARVGNLLTVSLDDALGVYRGAGHRLQNEQRLRLSPHQASPGLTVGPLPPGGWVLTLSAHTLVSDHCALSIQIEAVMASSR